MTMQREYEIFCETLSSNLHKDPSQCACGGFGWISSPFDTWHKCRVHWDKHPHPEHDDEVEFYCSFKTHEEYKEYLRSQKQVSSPDSKITPSTSLP